MARVGRYIRKSPSPYDPGRRLTRLDFEKLQNKIGSVEGVSYRLCGGIEKRGWSENDIDVCASGDRRHLNRVLRKIGLDLLDKEGVRDSFTGGRSPDTWWWEERGATVDVFWEDRD